MSVTKGVTEKSHGSVWKTQDKISKMDTIKEENDGSSDSDGPSIDASERVKSEITHKKISSIDSAKIPLNLQYTKTMNQEIQVDKKE